MSTVIHHTFGPHVDAKYLWKTIQAYGLLFRSKFSRTYTEKFRRTLSRDFDCHVSFFASGRESLLALLRAMHIRTGDEIIVQGYTCVVVPNAIELSGAKPIFSDIDPNTLNMKAALVEPLITPKTRAILYQHTFGITDDLLKIRALCDKYGLWLIEDCAHLLPDDQKTMEVGSVGDAILLSFGRDKAISGIGGGAVLVRTMRQEKRSEQATHNTRTHEQVASTLRELEQSALFEKTKTTAILLSYAFRMAWIVRPYAGTRTAKILLALLKKTGLITPILTSEEKNGHMEPVLKKNSEACAFLALYSYQKLPELNKQRRLMTEFFLKYGRTYGWPMLTGIQSSMPLLKFPLFIQNAETIRKNLEKEDQIFLNDGWTNCSICPSDVCEEERGFHAEENPNAQSVGIHIVSLPTHPTMTLLKAAIVARRFEEERKRKT